MEVKDLRVGNYIKAKKSITVDENHFELDIDRFSTLILNKKQIEYFEPIPLTEEWLLKFGFEDWGKGNLYSNEYESYNRFVLHNVLDGTSNFEVHYIKSTYGGSEHYEYIISCDEDDRLNWGNEIKYVHQLQNLYFVLTGKELTIS